MNDTSAHTERSSGTSGRRPPETNTGDGQKLTLVLPPAVVAQLVADVVNRVKAELAHSSPWLTLTWPRGGNWTIAMTVAATW